MLIRVAFPFTGFQSLMRQTLRRDLLGILTLGVYSTLYFTGEMDQVTIWNTVIDEASILANNYGKSPI